MPPSSSASGSAKDLSRRIRALADPARARVLQSFFKTRPGQYAHGDVFLGLKVPTIRKLVREFRHIEPLEASLLVRSRFHEERLAGLLLWVQAFEKGTSERRARIFRLYLEHKPFVNNWDLVDGSAPQIVGGSLVPNRIGLLYSLAESERVWDRRISVLATFAFIKAGVFEPTFDLCRRLLRDKHDLIHKACGWMLREAGKRDRQGLKGFLEQNANTMPRTMLRYALEHFPTEERARFVRKPG